VRPLGSRPVIEYVPSFNDKRWLGLPLYVFKPLAVLGGAELLGRHLNMWRQGGDAHYFPDDLADRLQRARERVALNEMSDAELKNKIKELEAG